MLAVAASETPNTSLVRAYDTHRLIPSRFGNSVLATIADSEAHLADLFELDSATNDRLLAEHSLLPGIGIHELIFGVPYYRIVNAAFTHAHPLGSRFNGPDRGAWYCGLEVQTAQQEAAYHKTLDLIEVDYLYDEINYIDYLADFSGKFHDLRNIARYGKYLNPMSYVSSQELAQDLLAAGSLGVVYPSVRNTGGTCIACFRPVLVTNVREDATYQFAWNGRPEPEITRA